MKYSELKRIIILSSLLMAFLAVVPFSSQAEILKQVKTENVCMVNDEDMGKPQVPIKVKGKTYYGCCAMCVSSLTNDLKARQSVDPVSGHVVDKSDAIIGAKADGSVLYFENETTFAAYQQHEKGDTP
jgi:YHS domain-containing protein